MSDLKTPGLRIQMMDNKFIESVRDFMRQSMLYYKADGYDTVEMDECDELRMRVASDKFPGYNLYEEYLAGELLKMLFIAQTHNLKLPSAVIELLKTKDIK